ncbi:MAG: hypothetical protein PHZ19_09660 [Candidatus Thermoplasmatota archaeon]|nr:hypothetical protein [Candidatus Thermoplasmatota archaeon]
MNITEIVEKWLRDEGYDGLLHVHNGCVFCRCGIDGGIVQCGDTFPLDCVPAVKFPDGILGPAEVEKPVPLSEKTNDTGGRVMENSNWMTVADIVRQWLLSNGYDGLYCDWGEGCGCGVDDLAPCRDPYPCGCVAARKGPDGLFYPVDVFEMVRRLHEPTRDREE